MSAEGTPRTPRTPTLSSTTARRLSRLQSHLTMSSTAATTSTSPSPSPSPPIITSPPPTPTMNNFNALSEDALQKKLLTICNSVQWSTAVAQQRPFHTLPALVQAATNIWYQLGASAWRDAFNGHGTLGKKIAEQKEAMSEASKDVVDALTSSNAQYESIHGHKCITFAAGKDSQRLLDEVVSRTSLSLDEELRRCAEQTMLITSLRLCRFISGNEQQPSMKDIQVVSPLTTHILGAWLCVFFSSSFGVCVFFFVFLQSL